MSSQVNREICCTTKNASWDNSGKTNEEGQLTKFANVRSGFIKNDSIKTTSLSTCKKHFVMPTLEIIFG